MCTYVYSVQIVKSVKHKKKKKKKKNVLCFLREVYFLGLDSSLFFPPSDGPEGKTGGGRGGSVWTVVPVSVDRP